MSIMAIAASYPLSAQSREVARVSHAKGSDFDNDALVERTRESIAQWPQLRGYLEGPWAITITAKGGKVTLEGTVTSTADRDKIDARANAVTNVFWVQNNLKVARR